MRELLKEKRNFWLLAWPAGFAIYIAALKNREAAEHVFARGLFRGYAWLMSHLTGWIPFSLAEILLILFFIGVLVLIILGIARTVRRKNAAELARMLRNLLILCGIVYAWYMIGCGTNYYRYEFAEYSGLTVQKSSTQELYELCRELAVKTNEARRDAVSRAGLQNEAQNAPYVSYLTAKERKTAVRQAIEKLGERYDVLKGYYPKPKEVHFSRFMSRFGITGVYFPWTVEANVNVDTPDYSIPSTMCHELSHLRGFMREDEANYLGYLACVNSDEPELRYSGYMEALIIAGNRLYEDSAELYYEVATLYDDGIYADFAANNEYWKQFEDTKTNEIGEKVNDTYLKVNKQTDGTKSYGRMVDLLLAERRQNEVHD